MKDGRLLKAQETTKVFAPMRDPFIPDVTRDSSVPMTRQIYEGIRHAIVSGGLTQGSRLSSWQDLAAQLGVSRGTVRRAYELLKEDQLITTKGAGGTLVAQPPPRALGAGANTKPKGLFYDFQGGHQYFQMGIPAQDQFPHKTWLTAWRRALSSERSLQLIYPDPRGLLSLRKEIASYLAAARGLKCTPDRVFITSGFTGALGIVLAVLKVQGQRALVEEPGFPRIREALHQAGIQPVGVEVDEEGIVISRARSADTIRLAVITPGQQAPLGMPLSRERRRQMMQWASEVDGWIVEDDYAGELQLSGKAVPALAADDGEGRIFHIGSFSKTLNPGLRVGYLVVPEIWVARFEGYVAHLAPAGSIVTQQAIQHFMSGGHYARHLRRMKRLYNERKMLLVSTLQRLLPREIECSFEGGLSVRLILPFGVDDEAAATKSQLARLGAIPLSTWYQGANATSGLILGIANVHEDTVESKCRDLLNSIGASGFIRGA